MSHLSDLQEEIGTSKPAQGFYMTEKLNFVKYLVQRYADTSVDIYADVEWERFQNKMDKKNIHQRENRNKMYEALEKDVKENWTDLLCKQYFEASSVELIPETIQWQKALILDLEYNYIMQASNEDLKVYELMMRNKPMKVAQLFTWLKDK